MKALKDIESRHRKIVSVCFCCLFLGCMRELCVIRLHVTQDEDNSDHLTDGNPNTFWETDGGIGMHWIKVSMKPSTIIRWVVVCVA